MFSSGKFPKVQLLSWLVILFPVVFDTSILPSLVAAPICNPTRSTGGGGCFYPILTFFFKLECTTMMSTKKTGVKSQLTTRTEAGCGYTPHTFHTMLHAMLTPRRAVGRLHLRKRISGSKPVQLYD